MLVIAGRLTSGQHSVPSDSDFAATLSLNQIISPRKSGHNDLIT
jgi:hypothetical protein